MAKKETQLEMSNVDGFVTVSSGGFPPNWNPEADGEYVDIIPIAIRSMKAVKGKKAEKMKQGYVFDAQVIAFSPESHFTQGGAKNQVEIEISGGTIVSINLNATLLGESAKDRKVAYQSNPKTPPEFTIMTQYFIEANRPMRIIFHGRAALGGGRSVKRFEIKIAKSDFEHLTGS